jgi:CRISPR-associated protein Cas2
MRVVVSYDVSKDRSRRKVAGILAGVLTRVQYSVFEGEVPAKVLAGAVKRALRFIDPETDSLRVYHLCAACAPRIDVYGRTVSVETEEVRIL